MDFQIIEKIENHHLFLFSSIFVAVLGIQASTDHFSTAVSFSVPNSFPFRSYNCSSTSPDPFIERSDRQLNDRIDGESKSGVACACA
jgi:hypothetical protein